MASFDPGALAVGREYSRDDALALLGGGATRQEHAAGQILVFPRQLACFAELGDGPDSATFSDAERLVVVVGPEHLAPIALKTPPSRTTAVFVRRGAVGSYTFVGEGTLVAGGASNGRMQAAFLLRSPVPAELWRKLVTDVDFFLVVGGYGPRAVLTLDQARALLEEHRDEDYLLVTLNRPLTLETFTLILHEDKAHATLQRRKPWSCWSSRNPEFDGDELESIDVFRQIGQSTEIEASHFVARQVGLNALEVFFESGRLDDRVTWRRG